MSRNMRSKLHDGYSSCLYVHTAEEIFIFRYFSQPPKCSSKVSRLYKLDHVNVEMKRFGVTRRKKNIRLELEPMLHCLQYTAYTNNTFIILGKSSSFDMFLNPQIHLKCMLTHRVDCINQTAMLNLKRFGMVLVRQNVLMFLMRNIISVPDYFNEKHVVQFLTHELFYP